MTIPTVARPAPCVNHIVDRQISSLGSWMARRSTATRLARPVHLSEASAEAPETSAGEDGE
jgi:predicted secreted protein